MLTVRNSEKFDWAGIGLKECADGNILDAEYTLRIYNLLIKDLERLGGLKLYESLISPITEVFADIEYNGMDVDPNEVKNLDKILKQNLKDLEVELREISEVGDDFNFNSVKQVAQLLYVNSLGEVYNFEQINRKCFGLYPPDRTEKGDPATDSDTLNLTLIHIAEELNKRG